MKRFTTLLLFVVVVLTASIALGDNEQDLLFNKNSCSNKEPQLSTSNKLNLANTDCPFELQLSRLTYKSSSENEPLIVSLVRKPAIVDETTNSHPTDDIKIDALLIQAVHSDDPTKIIGSWRGFDAFRTIDCGAERDTLVEIGRVEDDIVDLEWQFTSQQPLKKDSSIVFM